MVVAAGGLGTRVQGWSRYLPKEWLPVGGRPGIVHLLEEIAELGPAHVVVVYHPYYERFTAWARHALAAQGHDRYLRSAGHRLPAATGELAGMTVEWVAQIGAYGDLTSLLNGADHLAQAGGGGELYVAFGDNVYPQASPLAELRQAPPGVAVLARPYRAELAPQRGVIVTEVGPDNARRCMIELVEKPSPRAAAALEHRYGVGGLMLLEGRARVDAAFIDFAREHTGEANAEPRLSLVLAAWARTHPVRVVSTPSEVVDLGAPDGWSRRKPCPALPGPEC
ncbi:NTP transferase domain-containing protein [Sphaerisporangium sp. NPDC051017]|uniref:NTP transferase domain-containing protein n=1 Tax=Sphaerisporangium sp. NPDC051017 TaxID=3154636 RepID=UPI00342BFCE7